MGRAKPLIAQSGVGFRAVRPDAHKTYKTGGKLSVYSLSNTTKAITQPTK